MQIDEQLLAGVEFKADAGSIHDICGIRAAYVGGAKLDDDHPHEGWDRYAKAYESMLREFLNTGDIKAARKNHLPVPIPPSVQHCYPKRNRT